MADKAGVSLSHVMEVPDIGNMLCFVGAGIGITLLPASTASMMAHSLMTIPLADRGSSPPLLLAYKKDNPLSAQLRDLVEAQLS